MEKLAQAILLRLASFQEGKYRQGRSRINHPGFEVDVKVGSFRLLAELVGTSYRLGGTLTREVWKAIGECCAVDYASAYEPDEQEILEQLMESDCSPLNNLAAEVFTHIGLAFGIPEEEYPFSPVVDDEAKRATLLLHVLKRDGTHCPITGVSFYGTTFESLDRSEPVLTYIIPISVFEKPETIQFLRILCGINVQKLVEDLSSPSEALDIITMNSLALPHPIAQAFKQGLLGIQHTDTLPDFTLASDIASDDEPYTLRFIAPEFTTTQSIPIRLHDGSPVRFGQGLLDPCSSPVDERYPGRLDLPHPLLCNLRYEISCALQESGVRDLIVKLTAEANQPLESPTEEIAIPHPQQLVIRTRSLSFLGAEAASERVRRIVCGQRRASLSLCFGSEEKKDDREQFCEVLSAKLMICGRAAVMI